MLSATSQSSVALILLRVGFGFGVGGSIPPLIVMLVECSPPDAASLSVALTQCFFALGGIFVASLADAILDSMGWAWLVFFASLPLLLCAPFYMPWYIFESPVWLAAAGRADEAQRVVGLISEVNGDGSSGAKLKASLIPGGSASSASSRAAADGPSANMLPQLQGVFVVHWRLSLPLFLIWMITSFTYYGIVFLLPTYLNAVVPTWAEYTTVLLTALAEIPGYLGAAWLADRYGRRTVIVVFFAASTLSAFLMGWMADVVTSDASQWGWMLFLSCCGKAAVSGAFLAVMIYASEAYPTLLAVTGYGCGNAFTRLLGMITPTVGQVLLDSTTPFWAFATYGAACLLGVVVSALLPFDTLGRDADAEERRRAMETIPLHSVSS